MKNSAIDLFNEYSRRGYDAGFVLFTKEDLIEEGHSEESIDKAVDLLLASEHTSTCEDCPRKCSDKCDIFKYYGKKLNDEIFMGILKQAESK